MTTVLVVEHERGLADEITLALRTAGYHIRQCCGPEAYHCPILDGERCDFVDEADLLIYGVGLEPVGPETDAILHGLLRFGSPATPLIIVDDQSTRTEAIETLASRDRLVRILRTPYSAEQVVQTVAEALAQVAASGTGRGTRKPDKAD